MNAEAPAGYVPFHQRPKAEQKALSKEVLRVAKEAQQPKPSKRSNGFELKGYVRCELGKDQKEEYLAWEREQDEAEVLGRLVKAVDSGYLIKAGIQGQGAQASLCAYTTGQDWDGYVLVAHAGSAIRAAMLLVYKHEVIMQSTWSEWLQDDSEESFR